ncbi:hypothetical protein ACFYZB_34270 [Streptomyces sp. NPDC001852]|uniref:hypothetical protein n=1 Tax=Streptomyces sp. NPDC001852 TaxID=3364619 RepID=UPI0036A26FA9
MDFPTRLQDVHRRPGAYGLDGSYLNYVAFVNGADAASDGELLRNFRPWLAERLGRGTNLVWWVLVQDIYVADADVPGDAPLDNEALCNRMFSLLIEYLTDGAD